MSARSSVLTILACCAFLAPSVAEGWEGSEDSQRPYTPAHSRLIAEISSHHTLQGRLSGGLFPAAATTPAVSRLLAVTANLEKAVDDDRSPANLAALASWRVLSGSFDTAARLFEEALGSAPTDTRLHNDLGVCLLEWYRGEGNIEHLLRALEQIDRAAGLDQNFEEAAYNRAIVLDKLAVRREAARAWRTYLKLHRGPKGDLHPDMPEWLPPESPKPEPQGELGLSGQGPLHDAGSLEAFEKAVRAEPEKARLRVQDEILPNWAEAFAAGNSTRAVTLLETASGIAEALAVATGDLLPRATVAHLLQASTAEQATNVATGFLAYGHARREWKASHLAKACELFDHAERELTSGGSPFWAAARLARTACAYEEKRLQVAQALLSPLLESAQAQHYQFIVGRGLWLEAMIELETGKGEGAAVHLEQALQIFEMGGERGHALQVNARLANAYSYLGDHRRAWNVRSSALEAIRTRGASIGTTEVLAEAARAASREGFVAAGLAFQGEHLDLVGEDQIGRAEGLRRRSLLYHRSGRDAAALADIHAALAEAERIEDPSFRRHVRAGVLTALGSILVATEPAEALTALSEAKEIYDAAGFRFLNAEILLDRSRGLRALGQATAAERDLLAALQEFEDQRSLIDGHHRQITFFDRAREVVEDLVSLRIKQGRPDLALAALETGRAKSLLRPSVNRSDNSDRTRGRVPDRSVILEYLITDEETYAWALRGLDMEFRTIPVGRRRIEELVLACRAAILAPGRVDQPACAEIRSLLVQPFEHWLVAADEVAFVADGSLHALPFGALPGPSGSPLIASQRVVMSPSATVYIGSMNRADRQSQPARTSESASWTVLAVGNPTFDSDRYAGLVQLPAAESEARAAAAAFPGSEMLLGPEATVSRFLAGLARHEVVHFAGHALVNLIEPERSQLLFTPETGRPSGSLEPDDLLAARLQRTQLVILSACSTQIGAGDLEGTGSLALPFLQAGVPSVIGSLWPVDDRATEVFWRLFYQSLRTLRSPSGALRAAQLKMSASPEGIPASAWAAFQLTAASASRRRRERG